MNDLPEPLVPRDCDLRGLEWMPLYGDRLFASDTWLEAGPEARCAALALWWGAWKQCPAGSLANSDRVLCQLAGYGLAIKQWAAIKDEAMRGWIKCSDGRLYHPVVCDLALEAWEKRQESIEGKEGEKERQRRHREQRRAMFEALRNVGVSVAWNVTTTDLKRLHDETFNASVTPNSVTGNAPVTPPVTRTATAKTGQDITGQENKKETPANAGAKKAGDGPPIIRGTRLAENWQPSPEDRAYAVERGLDPDRILEDFRGYWLAKAGKDAVKTDWSLTWQSWCRREAERHPPPPNLLTVAAKNPSVAAAFSAYDPPDVWTKPPINAVIGTTGNDVGKPCVGGWYIDFCAQKLLEITGIRDTPRSDWSVLADWLRDGFDWDNAIAPTLARIAAGANYSPPGSLRYFDRAVREARRAA